jgi:hypothetical protein
MDGLDIEPHMDGPKQRDRHLEEARLSAYFRGEKLPKASKRNAALSELNDAALVAWLNEPAKTVEAKDPLQVAIKDLNSEDFDVRTSAAEKLIAAGPDALPLLLKELNSDSCTQEQRKQIRGIADFIAYQRCSDSTDSLLFWKRLPSMRLAEVQGDSQWRVPKIWTESQAWGETRHTEEINTIKQLRDIYETLGDSADHVEWCNSLLVLLRKPEEVRAELSKVETYSQYNRKDLTGAELATLADLTNLRHITIQNCFFTKDALKEIGKMKTLGSLWLLDVNVADEDLAHLSGLTDLKTLRLDSTLITAQGMKHLGGLTNLEILDVNPEALTDEGLGCLSGLGNLAILHLEGAPITNEGAKVLKGFKKLVNLHLNNTQITDEALASLSELKELKTLGLDDCLGINGSGLRFLGGCKELSGLDLNGCPIDPANLKHLEQLEALRQLNLGRTHLTNKDLAALKPLKKLDRLSLRDNPGITDEGAGDDPNNPIGILMELKDLSSLDLTGTRISQEGIARLRKALPNCSITGPLNE